MGWSGLGGGGLMGGLFWVCLSAFVRRWVVCCWRDSLWRVADSMSSFFSQPGMGMVMWVRVSGCGARFGLCGISLYEGCEVFGDGHVVCVCLGDELLFEGGGDFDGEGGAFSYGGFGWASLSFSHRVSSTVL